MRVPKGLLGKVIVTLFITGVSLFLVPGIIIMCNLSNVALRHKTAPFILIGFVLSGIGNIILAVWQIKTGVFLKRK